MGDTEEIERLVGIFFAAFTTESHEPMQRLRRAFLQEAVIVRTCGDTAVYDVDGFLEPRAALMASGRFSEFREWPTGGRVEVFGDVAHWFGSYAKAWIENGIAGEGRGMKSIQFVRTTAGWRISAAAWDDERDGVSAESSATVFPTS